MDANRLRTFVIILAVILFSFCWSSAALMDSDWHYGKMMVSDLGVSNMAGVRILFFVGCISAGSLLVLECILCAFANRKYADVIPAVTRAMSGVCLVGIGAFNEHTPYHSDFAMAFLVLVIITMLMIMVVDVVRRKWGYAIVPVVMFLLSALSLVGGVPLAEANAIVIFMIWVVFLLFRGGSMKVGKAGM